MHASQHLYRRCHGACQRTKALACAQQSLHCGSISVQAARPSIRMHKSQQSMQCNAPCHACLCRLGTGFVLFPSSSGFKERSPCGRQHCQDSCHSCTTTCGHK